MIQGPRQELPVKSPVAQGYSLPATKRSEILKPGDAGGQVAELASSINIEGFLRLTGIGPASSH